ncbi:MAG: peptide deformylase [Candidatus Atribacteria bacterium]|nr:peptide deformylase [Candidatus Atribacteria bacterium]
MSLSIRFYGDQILREKAQPVENIDGKIVKLLSDMRETMHAASGVGLAGNQIGVPLQLIAVINPETGEDLLLINPRIQSLGEEKEVEEEGCLSFPQIFSKVERPRKATVEAFTPSGKEIVIEAEGFLARILQHEIDHLQGILFIDRLSPRRRLLVAGKLRKINSYGREDANR